MAEVSSSFLVIKDIIMTALILLKITYVFATSSISSESILFIKVFSLYV